MTLRGGFDQKVEWWYYANALLQFTEARDHGLRLDGVP